MGISSGIHYHLYFFGTNTYISPLHLEAARGFKWIRGVIPKLHRIYIYHIDMVVLQSFILKLLHHGIYFCILACQCVKLENTCLHLCWRSSFRFSDHLGCIWCCLREGCVVSLQFLLYGHVALPIKVEYGFSDVYLILQVS